MLDLLRCVLTATLLLSACGSTGSNRVSTVTLKRVVDRGTAAAPLHQISFSWDFPDRQEVEIAGLGVVGGRGMIESYFTPAKSLEFRDAVSRKVLLRRKINASGVAMGGGNEPDLPRESEFPQPYRTGKVTSPTFADQIIAVIQRYYPAGFVSNTSSGVIQYTTTYRSLNLNAMQFHAEVAILIEQPYHESSGNSFRVRFIIRDRPRLSSDWRYRDDRSSQAILAGQAFVDTVVQELQR